VTIHLCGPPGRSGEQPAARLALLRAGVAEPPGSPPTLVRSYRTVSPSPVPGGPGHRRSSLCCPVPTGRPVLALASALLCGAPTFLDHPGVAAVTGPTHHRAAQCGTGRAIPHHVPPHVPSATSVMVWPGRGRDAHRSPLHHPSQEVPVLALPPPPGAIRRPARHLVHATAAFVGVSLALAARIRP
jgi:hypothetical protein